MYFQAFKAIVVKYIYISLKKLHMLLCVCDNLLHQFDISGVKNATFIYLSNLLVWKNDFFFLKKPSIFLKLYKNYVQVKSLQHNFLSSSQNKTSLDLKKKIKEHYHCLKWVLLNLEEKNGEISGKKRPLREKKISKSKT